MFTPAQLEGVPIALERLFKDLETRIMLDIIRRLKNNNNEIIRAADWQINRLYELGKSKTEIKEEIQKALNASDKEINNIYENILAEGYARNEGIYTSVGRDFIPFGENKPLQQLINAVRKQTSDECKNITGSMGFAVKQPNGKLKFKPIAQYYQKTLDNAVIDIASGAFDYNTVLRRTVSEMTNSGLRTVDYASGYSTRIDVAVRRAVMTGFNQTVAKINEDNAKILDTEYFEVSYHGGARPSHQVWQGRVYSKQELIDICGLGSVTGLCGANCYHSYDPFVLGVDVRTYTDEQLDEMNAEENIPKEFNGKQYTKYEALQRQRQLERKMRAQRQEIKLLTEGAAAEDDIIAARCRYRVTSGEYTRFSEAMGIPQQRERVTIDGLGNIGQGKWKMDLSSKDFNDIIKLKGKLTDGEVRKWYNNHDKNIPNLIGKTKSIEAQARQACELRNTYRTQARDLMLDQEKRRALDISDPNKTFEELIDDKMVRKKLSYGEAVEDVLKTSTKTRKSVNKKFGLEE